MTPYEYKYAYKYFMKNDDVLYISEHRGSYDNKKKLKDYLPKNCDLILFSVSITRFEAVKVKNILTKKGYKIGIANILWIKPFKIKEKWISALKKSRYGGIVLDDDYSTGVGSDMAYKLMKRTGSKIEIMGLKDKSAGFSKKSDNLPPNSKEIIKKILNITKGIK